MHYKNEAAEGGEEDNQKDEQMIADNDEEEVKLEKALDLIIFATDSAIKVLNRNPPSSD